MDKSYKELSTIFRQYGLNGLDDELVYNLEQRYKELPSEIEFNKAANLLTSLGEGDIDYENMTWKPSENGVYAFDVEIFDVENMYKNFLIGVSYLDREELNFTNIVEDTSLVDLEDGTGSRSVSFDWNGQHFNIDAKVEGDWFDSSVADDLNRIIISQDTGKQLYFTSDGYQEGIVFYCDKEWANDFEKDTGLKLEEFNQWLKFLKRIGVLWESYIVKNAERKLIQSYGWFLIAVFVV